MCAPGCGQGRTSRCEPGCGALFDSAALHFSDLSKDSQHQFANAALDSSQAVYVDRYASVDQSPYCRLNVYGVTAQTIHGIYAYRVASANYIQKSFKARTI
jgi:hypothetical protein